MKIFFLHIPKTAGQSVHAALTEAYGEDAVCPARVNNQLKEFTITELNRYQVFSGHLDWSLLDCIKGPRYTFTVLREPLDRILSFYFFLKGEAENLDYVDLMNQQNEGLRAAKELSPKDYFTSCNTHLRGFIDDHYDNFYTHFFAGRRYGARGELKELARNGRMNESRLVEMAVENMRHLDGVFTVDNIGAAFTAISDICGKRDIGEGDYRVNVNTTIPAETRMRRLEELGADELTLRRLSEFCVLDNHIWKMYCGHSCLPDHRGLSD